MSTKAKQRLFEFACFHDEPLVAERLVVDGGFAPAREHSAQAAT